MFKQLGIFEIVSLCLVAGRFNQISEPHTTTTCEEFEQNAKFDPQAIVDSMWKIVYFWSNTTEVRPIIFSLVSKKRLNKFKAIVETLDRHLEIEWHRAIIMMEPRPGVQALFIYAGTPGAFRAVIKIEQRDKVRPYPEPLLKFADLRLKLVGRYLGMICCEDLTAFVLTRVNEVPSTEEGCIAAASYLGLRGLGGRSHLYHNRLRSDL
ncbi:uncharacterized protein LOC123669262 [Melitaea cinxia]|uniref:uncharacterized protein LOC123669262 n=1 Tax=Melitaea cinxia TaxID=113334 RepID=UPI001E27288D|nr:uncharacterized protein LOC123669262 [Melitaea cinxia]